MGELIEVNKKITETVSVIFCLKKVLIRAEPGISPEA